MAHQYYGGHQQGYAPPPGPPPQGGSPYPQQGYPPPPQGYAPPPGAPYGQPPPGQYGQPQQPYGQHQGYNQPPPANHGYYGQAGPGAPPPGGYNQPPPGPPPGGYGQPPMNGGFPAPPSPGYIPNQPAPMDCSRMADDLHRAMAGLGTNHKLLIGTLASLDPLQVNGAKYAYQQRHRHDLIKDIEDEGRVSGYYKETAVAIARGPLAQDVYNLNDAIKGLGTKESVLNDVLLSRSNADINAIKQAYQQTYKRSLESDVKGDLSMKTERLFTMVLAARRNEESAPVIQQQTDKDVQDLYQATEGKTGTDQITVCSILSSRSDGQIRAINQAYKARYHRSLEDVLKKEFSGHMEDALLFMLRAASDRAKHDADLLEATMAGAGTKDRLLLNRVVRIHWDRQRMSQAKAAYKHFHKRELRKRIEGETSGSFEDILVALVNSA